MQLLGLVHIIATQLQKPQPSLELLLAMTSAGLCIHVQVISCEDEWRVWEVEHAQRSAHVPKATASDQITKYSNLLSSQLEGFG